MNDDKAHSMNEAAGGASGLSGGLGRIFHFGQCSGAVAAPLLTFIASFAASCLIG